MSTENVLIVCGKVEYAKSIASLLTGNGYENADFALSADEGRRKLDLIEPDLIVVNTPLPDELGDEFVQDIAGRTGAGIIVLAGHDHLTGMQCKLEDTGALVLPKPVSKMTLVQTSRFASGTRKSIQELTKQKNHLKKRVQERKILEKAKWLLIEKLDMTETQAHRYIQKRAMDRRTQQIKIAEEIISNYQIYQRPEA